MKAFETVKPVNRLLQKHISYYYLDITDSENYRSEYICYPHYNNTISLYKSHIGTFSSGRSLIDFQKSAPPLQIFTPLRESILKVTQNGPVYKIGIVFKPFGINQFLATGIPINELISSPSFYFFENDFILRLFEMLDLGEIALALDEALLKILTPVQNSYIEKTILSFEAPDNDKTIDELAVNLGISRKHLNRLFKKHIGTSVQKYRSIVRFRQLMNNKFNIHSEDSLTALSHRLHYADQSHFIKQCKLLTGLTPSQFFKEGTNLGAEDTFWKFTD